MTTPGHDGEHGGTMDKIKSVWREAVGARDDQQDSGKAWGGQHPPPGGMQPGGNTVPVAYQGPPRMHGPAQPGGPVPLPNTPRGVPQIVSRDGDHDNGPDGRKAPEPTVAQAVPWQAPRPMSQPTSPPQLTPQQTNPRPLPQRAAPQPMPQRPPQSVPQPLPPSAPQSAPQPAPQSAPPSVSQPLPQRSAPPQPVPPEAGVQPAPAAASAQPPSGAVDAPRRNEAERPTTWQPVPAPAIEPTELAQPAASRTEAAPATADLTGPPSAATATTPEPAREDNQEPDDEIDDNVDNPAEDAESVNDRPAQPIRRSVWTEPEPATPRPPTAADRADTPDRPMPVLSSVPPLPDRTPNRIPRILPSHIPSHITDAAAGAWTRPQNGASTRPRGRHELFDAPYREADSMTDPEPVPSSPSRVAAAPPPADNPPATRGRFVPEDRATAYADRWSAVKSEFVDEPRDAVRKADTLVGELLADIARALAEQRAQLDRGLDSESTSTEDLRQAMHRYRDFFDRLLIL